MTLRDRIWAWRVWPGNWGRDQAEQARNALEEVQAQRPAVEKLSHDLTVIRSRNGLGELFEEALRLGGQG
jgi:hypothetical protein